VDGNGIYICAKDHNGLCGELLVKIAALPKAQFVTNPPTAATVQTNFIFTVTNYGGSISMYAAVNFDPISSTEPAWFIFKQDDKLYYNGLWWTNGTGATPEWLLSVAGDPGAWPSLGITNSFSELTFTSGSIHAPQLNGSNLIENSSHLMAPVSRKLGGVQYLWTSHAVGVNSNGLHDPNGTPASPADRTAIAWYKIRLDSPVAISDSGRIYDTAPVNPKFYYLPSVAVNKNGDMLLGFSGSSVNDYIGAYYTGKINNGSWINPPVR
jgi:hypothetical protein